MFKKASNNYFFKCSKRFHEVPYWKMNEKIWTFNQSKQLILIFRSQSSSLKIRCRTSFKNWFCFSKPQKLKILCFSTVSIQKNFFQPKKIPVIRVCLPHFAICLRLFVASVLPKLDALPTKTYKMSRVICLQFPWCCSENPPNCGDILINTWKISDAAWKFSAWKLH